MAKQWVRPDTVMVSDLGDEVVLLDTATRAMHTLNRTGRVVWMSIEDGIDAAVDRVAAQFAVDADTARRDVVELVDGLVASGLLVERG